MKFKSFGAKEIKHYSKGLRKQQLIIYNVLIGLLLIILASMYFHYEFEEPDMTDYQQFEKNIMNGRAGFYNSEFGFYCVQTKGKFEFRIEEVEDHEKCHSIVSENYKHFCIEKNVDEFNYYCKNSELMVKIFEGDE